MTQANNNMKSTLQADQTKSSVNDNMAEPVRMHVPIWRAHADKRTNDVILAAQALLHMHNMESRKIDHNRTLDRVYICTHLRGATKRWVLRFVVDLDT